MEPGGVDNLTLWRSRGKETPSSGVFLRGERRCTAAGEIVWLLPRERSGFMWQEGKKEKLPLRGGGRKCVDQGKVKSFRCELGEGKSASRSWTENEKKKRLIKEKKEKADAKTARPFWETYKG